MKMSLGYLYGKSLLVVLIGPDWPVCPTPSPTRPWSIGDPVTQLISTVEAKSNGTGQMLEQEDRMGLKTPKPYRDFEERVFRHRDDLTRLIRSLNADGKKILGYGASTKGNVLLQFCGLTEKDIPAIAEVNPDKFGCVTPGSHIPIVSEADAKAMQPDYFLVLPWHFKDGIIRRENKFLSSGGNMIFPFPEIEII